MYPAVPNIYDYTLASRTGTVPVTAAEIAEHLKIDATLVIGDFKAYLESLILTAIDIGEKYTRRVFYQGTFVGYLDNFNSGLAYEIRKSPLVSITKIERIKSGVMTEITSTQYYSIDSPDFSRVAPSVGYDWPQDYDAVYHAGKFTFVAGYADGSCPVAIKEAIKLHVSAMYTNRGDCDSSGVPSSCGPCALPTQAMNIYSQYKIYDMRIGI